MSKEQFSKETAWPIEELNSMPFCEVWLPLMGLYDLEVVFRDKATKKKLWELSDFSWRDA